MLLINPDLINSISKNTKKLVKFKIKSNLAQSTCFRSLWYFFLFMNICLVLGYNVLYAMEYLDFFYYVISMMINSAFIISVFWILEFFKNCTFTGVPFMNQNLSEKHDIIKNISMFWIYGKIIDLLLYSILLFSSLFLKDSVEDMLTQDNFSGITFFVCYTLELVLNEIVPAFLVFDRQYIRSFEMSKIEKFKESFINKRKMKRNNNNKRKEIGAIESKFLESIHQGNKTEGEKTDSIEKIEGLFGTIKNDSYLIKNNATNEASGTNSLESLSSSEQGYWNALGVNNLKLRDLTLKRDVINGTCCKKSLGKCYLGKFKGYNVRKKKNN